MENPDESRALSTDSWFQTNGFVIGRAAVAKRTAAHQGRPTRQSPFGVRPHLCDLALFFGDKFVPDFPVVRLVAVILQFGHLAANINQGIQLR